MSTAIKYGIFLGGALILVILMGMASAFGWGAEHPADKFATMGAEEGEVDVDIDRHHHSVHHGGYYVPFYSSYGRRGSGRGAGGFRGGK